MNVFEKLTAIQVELKAPKTQKNTFGGYNYRNCEDILEALKPLLAKHKAACYLTNTTEVIGDRFYVKATAVFVDTENGEKIEASASAREEETKKGMDGAQVTGASSSYARKYALAGLFACDDTKDADSSKPLTAREQAEANGINLTGVAKYFGVEEAALTDEQIFTAIKMKQK